MRRWQRLSTVVWVSTAIAFINGCGLTERSGAGNEPEPSGNAAAGTSNGMMDEMGGSSGGAAGTGNTAPGTTPGATGGCPAILFRPQLTLEVVPYESLESLRGAVLEVCVDGACSKTGPLDEQGVPFGAPLNDAASPYPSGAAASAILRPLGAGQAYVSAIIERPENFPDTIELEVRLSSAGGDVWIDHHRVLEAPLRDNACFPVTRAHSTIYPESRSDVTCGSKLCEPWQLNLLIPGDIDGAIVCRGAACTPVLEPFVTSVDYQIGSLDCRIPGGTSNRIECSEHPLFTPASETLGVKLFRSGALAADLQVPIEYVDSYPNGQECDVYACRSASIDLATNLP